MPSGRTPVAASLPTPIQTPLRTPAPTPAAVRPTPSPIAGGPFAASQAATPAKPLQVPATVKSAAEAQQGRKSDWMFVGLIILVLIALLVGSVFLAVYLLQLTVRALGLWN